MRDLTRRIRALEELKHAQALDDGLPGITYVLHSPGHPEHGKTIATITRGPDGKGWQSVIEPENGASHQ